MRTLKCCLSAKKSVSKTRSDTETKTKRVRAHTLMKSWKLNWNVMIRTNSDVVSAVDNGHNGRWNNLEVRCAQYWRMARNCLITQTSCITCVDTNTISDITGNKCKKTLQFKTSCNFTFITPKGTSLRRTASFDVLSVKIHAGVSAVGDLKNQKK